MISLRNTKRESNSLDPDLVGPDLGPNCLQNLAADDTSRQKVNYSLCDTAKIFRNVC